MMECVPTESVEMAIVATPPPFKTPVPMVVTPSLKVTVPVGDAPATVAVKVTDWLKTEGFTEDASPVVVAVVTFCTRMDDVLGRSLLSPR